jgi:hypothetical protein
MIYLLTVTNESQWMFLETFTGTRKEADKRAQEIKNGLQKLLPVGSFDCLVSSAKKGGA